MSWFLLGLGILFAINISLNIMALVLEITLLKSRSEAKIPWYVCTIPITLIIAAIAVNHFPTLY